MRPLNKCPGTDPSVGTVRATEIARSEPRHRCGGPLYLLEFTVSELYSERHRLACDNELVSTDANKIGVFPGILFRRPFPGQSFDCCRFPIWELLPLPAHGFE